MKTFKRYEAADLTNCDREQIHIPGAIVPHGAMLVLDDATFEVLQVAGDIVGLLGVPPEELLGHSVSTIFNPQQIKNLHALNSKLPLLKPRHMLDPQMRVASNRPLDASMHRTDGALILEFEEADIVDQFVADPLAAVHELVIGQEEAASVAHLCQLACEGVRDLTGYDRVLVYRFMQDSSGWVIAESKQDGLAPFLDLHYPASDIPRQARALYIENSLRLIAQVNYEPARLEPTDDPRTGKPLDMSQAILRDVSPIHRQYLRNMGIHASMSISIVCGGELWGLVACHHYAPRRLPRHLRAICELFGSMFSYQVEAMEKREQFTERLASRTVLQRLMLNLAGAEDYAQGLTEQSPNLLDYIHGGKYSAEGVRQGGVAVIIKGKVALLGKTPDKGQIGRLVVWLDTEMRGGEDVFATDRLGEIWEEAKSFADVASGLLAISVSPDPSDFIIWFRPELVSTTAWAGEPRKVPEKGLADDEMLTPRKSFEIWKETVRGRAMPWSQPDFDAARDLRTSLLDVVLRRITDAARERQIATNRDRLMMAELDHRVKNTLANIAALVVQTSVSAESLSTFVEDLAARIQSMAKAHSLLSQNRWEGVSVESLLREELNPYLSDQVSFTLRGPDVVLTSKSALALSLAIHELVSNASKFGSLTVPGGRVAVGWTLSLTGSLELAWTETGGPLVAEPARRGFGSTLIERALALETSGEAVLRFLPTGVVCSIKMPPASIASSQPVVTLSTLELPNRQTVPERPVKSLRVLLVEDSSLVVGMLELVFESFGWTMVGPAVRVRQALAMIEAEAVDAALLDINLDGEMSWDVAAALKARGIPFVLCTGYEVSHVLPDSLKGVDVVRKPYKVDELEKAVLSAIKVRGDC